MKFDRRNELQAISVSFFLSNSFSFNKQNQSFLDGTNEWKQKIDINLNFIYINIFILEKETNYIWNVFI